MKGEKYNLRETVELKSNMMRKNNRKPRDIAKGKEGKQSKVKNKTLEASHKHKRQKTWKEMNIRLLEEKKRNRKNHGGSPFL